MSLITFDFDETLTRPVFNEDEGFWESSLLPNEDILRVLRTFTDAGHEVHIVTTRFHSIEPREFAEAHGLKISGIHFTEGKLKFKKLNELGSVLHFDDCISDAAGCRIGEVPCLLVVHPFDRDHNSNIHDFDHFDPTDDFLSLV